MTAKKSIKTGKNGFVMFVAMYWLLFYFSFLSFFFVILCAVLLFAVLFQQKPYE